MKKPSMLILDPAQGIPRSDAQARFTASFVSLKLASKVFIFFPQRLSLGFANMAV